MVEREESWKQAVIAAGLDPNKLDDEPTDLGNPTTVTTSADLKYIKQEKNPEFEERRKLAIEAAYAKVLEKTGYDPNEVKKLSGSRKSLLGGLDDDDDERNITIPKKYAPPQGYGPNIMWEKPSFEFDRGAFEPMRKPPKFNFDVEFEESMPPEKMVGEIVDVSRLSAEDEMDGTFHVTKCTKCEKDLRVKKMALLLECPNEICKHVMPNTTTAST